MQVSDIAYYKEQIRELAEFPGIPKDRVLKELDDARFNHDALKIIYDRLMEDCYGDENSVFL